MNQKVRFYGALAALAVSLVCVHLEGGEAQKTAQRWSSTGSNQQSVYGGYQQSPVQQSSSSSFEQQQQVSRQPVASPAQQKGARNYQASSSSSRQTLRQPVYQQQQESYESSSSSQSAEADAEPAQYGAVAGQPGRDFPAYTRVPKTSFSCEGLPYDYGMYADEETGCQAYHLCYQGRKESFLCGVGTVFNQRILHCDYWYSVDCGKSSQYYSSNAYMGSSQPEPGPAEANAAPAVSQQAASSSYSRNTINRPAAAAPSNFRQQSFNRNTQQQVQESY